MTVTQLLPSGPSFAARLQKHQPSCCSYSLCFLTLALLLACLLSPCCSSALFAWPCCPTFFFHSTMFPWLMVGESAGMLSIW